MDRKLEVAKTKLNAFKMLVETGTNLEILESINIKLMCYNKIPEYLETFYELQQLTIKAKELVRPTDEEIELLEENGLF